MSINIKEKLKNYFEGEADVMQLRYKHSSTTSHPTDVGSNRENVVIDFFNRHLPHKFTAIQGGKVFDSNGNASKQVDVVIYDNSIPRLASYQHTLFLAEGVSTAIEIKPKLTKEELKVGLDNLKSIKGIQKKGGSGIVVGNFRKDIHSGIFSFETSMSFQEILNTIYEEIGEDRIVDFIVVNNKYLILRNSGEWKTINKSDGREEILKEDYLNFTDGKMILYKFFMLICKEIGNAKLLSTNLENYINMDFNEK